MAKSKVVLVYIGAHRHEAKLVHIYSPISPEGALPERGFFYQAPLALYPPGSRIEFEFKGNARQVIPSTARYIGKWHDEEDIIGWVAASAAVLASEASWNDDPPLTMQEALSPLRKAYMALDDAAKPIMIAQVVNCITGEL
jgi:hypothetical protein